ncbi:MAG: hypothetical protein ACTHU0_03220, partial [Kofleriaceae bacterium]
MGDPARATLTSPARRTSSGRRTPSFRLKVTLIASLLAAIPLLIVAWIVEDVNERALGDANQEVMSVVIGNVSGVADGVTERADATLAMLASQLADASLDPERRIAHATTLVAQSPLLSAVGVYDPQGRQIDVVRDATAAAPPLPEPLPPAMLAPERPRFGAVAFADGQPFLLRAARVQGAAETWTLAAWVSLAPIRERLTDIGLVNLPGHQLFVITTDLQIVADASGERVGRRITRSDAGILDGIGPGALDKGVLVAGEFVRADGERMLGEIRTIDDAPLAVIIELPHHQAYHSLSAVRRIVIFATLAAIAIAV